VCNEPSSLGKRCTTGDPNVVSATRRKRQESRQIRGPQRKYSTRRNLLLCRFEEKNLLLCRFEGEKRAESEDPLNRVETLPLAFERAPTAAVNANSTSDRCTTLKSYFWNTRSVSAFAYRGGVTERNGLRGRISRPTPTLRT